EHEGETAADEVIPITPDMMVPASLSLLDLVNLFPSNRRFFFVLTGNDVTHTVWYRDLDALPMKLSLFALFMELESVMIRLISTDQATLHGCLSCLSEQRLTKARGLCGMKYKNETDHGLLLCTTFIDKKEMIWGHPALRQRLSFSSTREGDRFFVLVENVRNQIAHSDSIFDLLTRSADLRSFIGSLRKVTSQLMP
ncbi:MAG TPA: hypothetical protein VFI02_21235, partial [Armatimonadota bacterium]|nr:hypothetical protein [Armatimonadota bacterium]